MKLYHSSPNVELKSIYPLSHLGSLRAEKEKLEGMRRELGIEGRVYEVKLPWRGKVLWISDEAVYVDEFTIIRDLWSSGRAVLTGVDYNLLQDFGNVEFFAKSRKAYREIILRYLESSGMQFVAYVNQVDDPGSVTFLNVKTIEIILEGEFSVV